MAQPVYGPSACIKLHWQGDQGKNYSNSQQDDTGQKYNRVPSYGHSYQQIQLISVELIPGNIGEINNIDGVISCL
jgi:hypothetical protein